MCGRYYIPDAEEAAEIRKIIAEIDKKYSNKPYKTGEIRPTNTVPILTDSGADLMSWGFPRYGSKGVVINARSETAADKRMFSKALRERRCVIPAGGFYEWQKKDATKPKDKFLFISNKDELMYMAGVYTPHEDEDKFVILTRDANISIADIHDRMPVVIYKQEIEDWINDISFVDFAINRDNVVLRREPS